MKNFKMGIRIAIVAPSAPPYSSGGVASAHYNLFRAFKSQGLSVALFTFFDNGASPEPERDIVRRGASQCLIKTLYSLGQLPFRLLQPGKIAYQSAVILRSSIGAMRMGQAVARFNPEIVILSDHGAPGLFITKKQGQRIILISHHNPARFASEPLLGHYSKFDARIAVMLENLVLKKVDCVVCPSRYMTKWFHNTYSFNGPVTTLPNLIDSNLIDSIRSKDIRKNLNLPSSATLIYLPSVGTRVKGARFLSSIIDGLFKSPGNQMGLYIPGYIEKEIKDKLYASPHANFFYMPGQLSYEDHIAIVKNCSFGITPAVMENFSMAILEATYSGVPMLAFRRGGNEDIIEDGKNGYLFPAFDLPPLIQKAGDLAASGKRTNEFKRQTEVFTREKFNSGKILREYFWVCGIN